MSDQMLPLLNNRFTVNIDSPRPDCSRRDVAFVRIAGMGSSLKNGVCSSSMRSLFGLLSHKFQTHRAELRRALDHDHFFYDWHSANLERIVDLRTLTIIQFDQHTDATVNCWRLFDCWIHTWQGPDFDAMNPDIAYETMTLCYRSLSWLNKSDLT
ncbi:phage tail protein [Candidatus Thiodiazotropha sp. CDECU1]|uniref:phage tail protein n=1 Tax=Candidatus Thiodiazotropha sp. CDECU1 TaxID=3065865 RepID=UPI00292CE6C5|nr:phage tail protein [Candidatus Thiodiazotropha sp. CDECU1]